jgi:NitT/TauT family transport system substrate-binding protein
MVSRHSAFYSPLIATIARGFPATYAILQPGQQTHELIRDGAVDVVQSAVSANWKPMDRGEAPLPVHFASINRRDGFFLAGRERGAAFAWKDLEHRVLLADHGGQPMAMLRYAAHYNGVDWSKIYVADRGVPERMLNTFRRGEGDYVHLQAPGPQLLEEEEVGWTVVSVGASMPEVAFSTLCCSREFLGTAAYADFFGAYKQTREWVRGAAPEEVAAAEASFFPGVSRGALAEAVRRYQLVGNWDGGTEITPELYEQALDVFAYSGGLKVRHPWSAVVAVV